MAANEPPDGPSGRPPIHTLDEPIDESGADEVEQRRAARTSALPDVAVEALKLKALGFSIMPLPTEKKYPPPADWPTAAKNNPAVFLTNPGTHNYAVLPPPGCFGWDVDKEAPELLLKVGDTLGVMLPETLTTFTPNGQHKFYRWPESVERPRGPMFGGVVTRWPLDEPGQGYLVGPGSVVVQDNGALGVYHSFSFDDEEPIAELPIEWALAAQMWRPAREVRSTSGPLAEVGAPKYELPESVTAGMRYESIRSYTAHLYNRGLSSNEMWPLVQAELAPRFTEKLDIRELRERFERAVRDIASRLGEPKALPVVHDLRSVSAAPVASSVEATGAESDTPSQEALVPPLFVPLSAFTEELRSREPVSFLVEGWVPAAGLTVLAGHPKSMKSLAALQMLGAFVGGGEWLGRDIEGTEVRVGLYLTREGSHSEMLARADALDLRHGLSLGNRLRFAYEQPIEFNAASYDRVSAYLAELEQEFSVLPGKLRVMLVLDPLRDLMPADGDENEAKTMAVVKRWCRSLIADFGFVGIVLVHHLRKSAAGSTGLEMSGSGAMYGAVDSTIIWKAKKEEGLDDEDSDILVSVSEMYGTYRVESRGEAPFKGRWRFDQTEGRIVAGVGRIETASGRAVPGTAKAGLLEALRGCGTNGTTVKTLGELVDISENNVRAQLARLSERNAAHKERGLWYADGFAPFQRDDVILPLAAESPDDPDDEVWVDPLHRLD